MSVCQKWLPKTVCFLLMVIALCFLCACSSSDYNDAVTKMEDGDYDEAAALFEALEDYKDSEQMLSQCRYNMAIAMYELGAWEEAIEALEELGDYENCEGLIIECKYNLALEAIDNEEWDTAITYLDGLNYSDSESVLEEVQIKKGMHENADCDFLEALETSVIDRLSNSDSDDYMSLVNAELVYLDGFDDATYYDSQLQELAQEYMDALYVQKEALGMEYTCDYQIAWQDGLVSRMGVLKALYEDYGFMEDNAEFVAFYVMRYDEQKQILEAYKAIEADIDEQTTADEFYWLLDFDTYTFSCTLQNNTEYKFSTVFGGYFYDEEGVLVCSPYVEIDDIQPGTSYNVIFDVSDPEILYEYSWSNYYLDVYVG